MQNDFDLLRKKYVVAKLKPHAFWICIMHPAVRSEATGKSRSQIIHYMDALIRLA